MSADTPHPTGLDLDAVLGLPADERYVLRLFVAGASERSRRAIANLRQLCETYLGDQYTLDVIDVYQQQELAHDEQIVATPTLLKKSPRPQRYILGDLSDTPRVLRGLGLPIAGATDDA